MVDREREKKKKRKKGKELLMKDHRCCNYSAIQRRRLHKAPLETYLMETLQKGDHGFIIAVKDA